MFTQCLIPRCLRPFLPHDKEHAARAAAGRTTYEAHNSHPYAASAGLFTGPQTGSACGTSTSYLACEVGDKPDAYVHTPSDAFWRDTPATSQSTRTSLEAQPPAQALTGVFSSASIPKSFAVGPGCVSSMSTAAPEIACWPLRCPAPLKTKMIESGLSRNTYVGLVASLAHLVERHDAAQGFGARMRVAQGTLRDKGIAGLAQAARALRAVNALERLADAVDARLAEVNYNLRREGRSCVLHCDRGQGGRLAIRVFAAALW